MIDDTVDVAVQHRNRRQRIVEQLILVMEPHDDAPELRADVRHRVEQVRVVIERGGRE